MRARLLGLIRALRREGIAVSVAETLDAMAAVAAAGVERPVLREALAAALVKDESDRATFDRLFDEAFPLRGPERARVRRGRRSQPGAAGHGRGPGSAGARGVRQPEHAVERGRRRAPEGEPAERAPEGEGTARGRAARARRLRRLPFKEFTGRDVVEAREVVRELAARLRARFSRRERRARRGRLDLRRTIRAAMGTGGVPVRLRFRGRRPVRPDLVALCDLSGSVAAASELCLALIAPAACYFRRAQLFAYVDRLCPVSVEDGHVAPGGRLDLHARSDFGRVLDELWRTGRRWLTRDTLLLILGDARNNRRPPRVDLLRAVRARVGRLVWLVPEPAALWGTGDSVLPLYAPHCDAVLECVDLDALVRALGRVL
jgi:uncharacterized protein with von Willebrand factor type A (vWA) domain